MNLSVEPERPRWPIDHLLNQLVGQPVRVVAEAFAPPRADGTVRAQMIPTADLILPDNRTPDGRPVCFEGVLESHLRRIGVVEVTLGVPAASAGSAAGLTDDRGVAAIVLPGPAIVRLA